MLYLYKKRLKSLREENNVKQSQIAKILNFHENTYGQFEREDTVLPLTHLITICDYFGVSIDYIFGLTNVRSYSSSKSEVLLNVSSIRLKEFRKENKITQDKLAKLLGIEKSSISKYENGIYLIPTQLLYDICKKYKMSADYLLGKTDEPKYFS